MTAAARTRALRRAMAAGAAILAACLAPAPLPGEPLPHKLSPAAPAPDWNALDPFQQTITRAEFQTALDTVFAPNHAARQTIRVETGAARITRSSRRGGEYALAFAGPESPKPVPRYWRPARELGPAPAGRPLEGLKIAVDPGHIGGRWARMEERFFQIGTNTPVAEGDMVLLVARRLVPQLETLGATVANIRPAAEPVTAARPGSLRPEALALLHGRGVENPREDFAGPADPLKHLSLRWHSEILFYRIREIRDRAAAVNGAVRPDLAICLHFNAEDWGDPAKPALVDKNHFHLLVNGCYSEGELEYDDIRFDMLAKLLGRSSPEEIALATAVAGTMSRALALPPYDYKNTVAVRAGPSPYVWARNLLANRLYQCPVLYLEPYVMNNAEVHARVQAGDFDGLREVSGRPRPSLYAEYADAVARALADYCSTVRAR